MDWVKAHSPVEGECPGNWELGNKRGTGSFQAKSLAEPSSSGGWRGQSRQQWTGLVSNIPPKRCCPTPRGGIRQLREQNNESLCYLRSCPFLKPLNQHPLCICFLGLPKTNHHIWWLKTTETYPLTVLEAESLKPRCWQSHAPSTGSRDEPFLASDSSWGLQAFLSL